MFTEGSPIGLFSGVLNYKTASSGAGGGDLYAELTPGQGEAWVVLSASGYHDDDGGARLCYWLFNDAAAGAEISRTSIAQLVFESLYNQCGFSRPLVLHYGQKLQFHTDGLVAGHVCTIRAIVAVVRGMEPWINT